MTDKELDRALELALATVTLAGKKLKSHFGSIASHNKGKGNSPVSVFTELDREIE